jgi:hypothetical protein
MKRKEEMRRKATQAKKMKAKKRNRHLKLHWGENIIVGKK